MRARYYILDALSRRWPGGGWREGRRGRKTVVVGLTGHLGDFLVATPMLRQLRRGLAGARIVWLVGAWNLEVARRYGWMCDEIWEWAEDAETQGRGRREWRQGAWEQAAVGWRLRELGAEVLVTTGMESPGKRFLANATRPRVWVGRGDRRPPRVDGRVETVFFPYGRDVSEVEELLRLGEAAGAGRPREKDARPFWRVEEGEREAARAFLERAGAGGGPLVAVSPGSGWSGKNWGGERFAEVAARLRKAGARVAWVGTKGESGLCPEGAAADWKWFGRFSLAELAAVLERCDLWIGNDGGAMHLASAVGCPTLSLWGPTREAKWAPRGERDRAMRGGEACAGCRYWDWRAGCAKESHECMDGLGVDEVAGTALEMLGC